MENERNCVVLTTARSELLSVDTEPSIPCTRSVISSPTEERTCFVCKTNTGKNILRISKVCVAAETDTSKTIRLNIMLQGHAVDLYAADICYHNHCLVYFNRLPKEADEVDPMFDVVRNHFFNYVCVKICTQKNDIYIYIYTKECVSIARSFK